MNFVRNTVVFALVSILALSCNKEDDSLPKPATGYFVTSITISEWGEEFSKIDFRYDNNNRMIGQTFDNDTIRYAYNNRGQLTGYSVDDYERYSFEYVNNRVTKIRQHDPGTDEVLDEIPVTYSDGTYSINGEAICKVGDQGQLLELQGEDVVFRYGEGAGVHQHLTLSPARYIVLEGEFTVYDLTLSNKELLGWEREGSNISMENQRNEQGLITAISIITPDGDEFQWDIEYEERELVP